MIRADPPVDIKVLHGDTERSRDQSECQDAIHGRMRREPPAMGGGRSGDTRDEDTDGKEEESRQCAECSVGYLVLVVGEHDGCLLESRSQSIFHGSRALCVRSLDR